MYAFEWLSREQIFESILTAPLVVQAVALLIGLLLAAAALAWLLGGASPATSDEYIANFHQPERRLAMREAPAKIAAGIATLGSGGALGYDLSLSGPTHALDGVVRFGPGGADATVNGRATAEFVNRWLSPYDIRIGGALTFQDAHVRVAYDYAESGAGSASGTLLWDGGTVRYVLSGRANAGTLPPLAAYLGEEEPAPDTPPVQTTAALAAA